MPGGDRPRTSTRVAPSIKTVGVPASFIRSLERVNAPREVIQRLREERRAAIWLGLD